MTGIELKKKIEEANVTQQSIAVGLGVTQQSMTSLFKVQDVGTEKLRKIAVIMNKPLSYFLGNCDSVPADGRDTDENCDDSALVETNTNYQATAPNTTEMVTIPAYILRALQQQLDTKDSQINALIRQLDKL